MAKRTKKLLQTEEEDYTSEDGVRLNRYMSDSGVCSRREADKFIEDGQVTVDGIKAELGTKVMKGQIVLLKGIPVKREEKLILIALNKPRGIVSTTDRREKDNIIDFLKFDKRIYPIGRLDKDSEGLILLTNDGSIVNKILRSGNYHEKEYIVTVDKPISAEFYKGMAEGVPILDTVTRPCTIKTLDKFTFQIILTQGLNRQIRRMCEYFGYKVITLKRIRIMNIHLGHLQIGGYRNVTDKEIASLTGAINDSVNTAEDKGKKDLNKTKSSDSPSVKRERADTKNNKRFQNNHRTYGYKKSAGYIAKDRKQKEDSEIAKDSDSSAIIGREKDIKVKVVVRQGRKSESWHKPVQKEKLATGRVSENETKYKSDQGTKREAFHEPRQSTGRNSKYGTKPESKREYGQTAGRDTKYGTKPEAKREYGQTSGRDSKYGTKPEAKREYGQASGRDSKYGAKPEAKREYGQTAGRDTKYGPKTESKREYGQAAGRDSKYGTKPESKREYGQATGRDSKYGAKLEAKREYGQATGRDSKYGAKSEAKREYGQAAGRDSRYGTKPEAKREYGQSAGRDSKYGAKPEAKREYGQALGIDSRYGTKPETKREYGQASGRDSKYGTKPEGKREYGQAAGRDSKYGTKPEAKRESKYEPRQKSSDDYKKVSSDKPEGKKFYEKTATYGRQQKRK